jgi:hypothetical protein
MGRLERHSRVAMMLAVMTAYKTMQVRASVVLAVFAAALGAAAAAAAWPGPPRTAAPHVKGTSGPPAAWLETERTRSGSHFRVTAGRRLAPISRRRSRGRACRSFAFAAARLCASISRLHRRRCTRPPLREQHSNTQRCGRRARRAGGRRVPVSSPSTCGAPRDPRRISSAFASADRQAAAAKGEM